MIEALPPYKDMRDSGVDWLGAVPAHWEVRRAKPILKRVSRAVSPDDEVVTCFRDGTVTLRKNRRLAGFTEAIQEIGYQSIRRGDLVVHAMDAFAGAIGVSDSDGKGSPVYIVCEMQDGNDAKYFAHIIREMSRSNWILALAKGIRERSTDFRYDALANQLVSVPPLEEQAAIVRFLADADRRIGGFVAAKQRLVGLLEEAKAAIVHRAVTKGLNPAAPTKSSGVPWLGDIPAHWDIRPIKRLSDGSPTGFTDGDWIESPYITTEGIRLIQTGNIGCGMYREKGFRYISEESFTSLKCKEFLAGQVLICRLGEPVARACIAPELNSRMITSVDVCMLKPSAEVDARFVVYAMSSKPYLDWVSSLVRGSTRDRVSRSMLGTFPMPLPPLDEQRDIIEQIENETATLDRAVATARAEIDLLREYRTRLIADVVTGKRDVRAAAAALPDIADDSPLPDLLADDSEEAGDMAEGLEAA